MYDLDTNFSITLPVPDQADINRRLLAHYPTLTASFDDIKIARKTNRMAIINTANRPWTVIDSECLANTYPALDIKEYYFSVANRSFEKTGQDIDENVICTEEIGDLLKAVAAFEPGIIYLRVSPHTRSEHLISLLHHVFDGVRLLVEFYDMTCLFSADNMRHVTANDTAAYQMALDGCSIALHNANTIITKAGGEKFTSWISQYPVKYCTYFPLISATTLSQPDNAPKLRRTVYAGSLSAREIAGGIGSVDGANLIAYFDAIKSNSKHSLEIINGVHSSKNQDMDPKFAPLIERYPLSGTSGSNVTYKRAMPINILVNYLKDFDIGLCCAHYENDYVESVTKCGLPNRIMAYIEAGLPVIIDDRFEYACDLITKYNAGIVVKAGDFSAYLKAIDGMDLQKCRYGLLKLRDFMHKNNKETLKALL